MAPFRFSQFFSICSLSLIPLLVHCSKATRNEVDAKVIGIYAAMSSEDSVAIPLSLPGLEGAQLVLVGNALPLGAIVKVSVVEAPAAIGALISGTPLASFRVGLSDKDGKPLSAQKPLIFSVPQGSVDLDTIVLQVNDGSTEVYEAQPLNIPLSDADEDAGPTILENLGVKDPVPETTETKLDQICGLDPSSVIDTQSSKISASDRTATTASTVSHLTNTTALSSISTSATVVIASKTALSLTTSPASTLPLAIKFNQDGENLSSSVRVISLTPQLNTMSFRKGVYDQRLLLNLKYSEDYINFLRIMYKNSYMIAPSISALKDAQLNNFADTLSRLANSPMARFMPAEQLSSFQINLNITFKNTKNNAQDRGCLGYFNLFPPLRNGELDIWSSYSTPYVQDDFPSVTKEMQYTCIFVNKAGGGWNWSPDIMDGVNIEDYEVADISVRTWAEADKVLTANPTYDRDKRRRDAMALEPVSPKPPPPAPTPPVEDPAKTDEELADPKTHDPDCIAAGGATNATALALDGAELQPVVYLGKSTGMWLPRWSTSSPITMAKLTGLTAGTFALSTVTPTSFTLTFTKASSNTGVVTYKVYYKAGTFTQVTPARIASAGTLAATFTDSGNVTISSLTPGTSYAVAVVASDEASVNAVYTPQTQATTSVTTLAAGSLTTSSVTTSGFNLTIAAATGGYGALTYKIYKISGTFSDSTAAIVASEGTLVSTLTDVSAATSISGLTIATSYQIGVVITDTLGTTVLAGPLTQATASNPAITAGALTAANPRFSSLNLTATAATGGSGTLTYKVYTKAGTFSAASVTAVEAEGTLFTTTTSVTSAIALTGLTGNTSYQLATIVSDTLGTKALYTPITQATADARLVFRLAAPNGNLGGTTGADAICQASRPTGITTAKALLVDGNNRIACTTANCGGGPGEHLDWVLAASAAYRNEAGSAVGTTTANGIFSFSMTAGLSAAGGEWFNGFSSAKNWTAANSDCTNFSTTGGVGNVGDAGSTSNSSLSIYDQNCNRTDVYLICVEQ